MPYVNVYYLPGKCDENKTVFIVEKHEAARLSEIVFIKKIDNTLYIVL